MLSRIQFDVLASLSQKPATTQRELAANAGLSLGSVNRAVRRLREQGLVDEHLDPTPEGQELLESHRVRGAVILAAGMGRRFAPLSFERPKALFRVRGEVLIERLIRQLREAGIEDIHVVVGPMKESFYYLEDKLGVKLVQTTEYATRNNHASLFAAREWLGNTYVCPSDQYYAQNLFSPYEWRSCATAVEGEGKTHDAKTAIELGAGGRIVGGSKSTNHTWRMDGPAYLDDAFARDYLKILADEYYAPDTLGKLWETIFIEHAAELPMYARKVEPGVINEFDYLGDLRSFDADFFENVDSAILDNICATLECTRDDITDVRPLDAGLTNLSVLFSCKGQRYVYRHPGAGTDEIVNREAETFALEAASRLGLDTSFVHEDWRQGWKISRFISGCTEFDYANPAQVAHAMRIARELHNSGVTSPWKFDFYDESKKIVRLLKAEGWPLPPDFEARSRQIAKLVGPLRAGAGKPVLCHNDFYGPNLLVRGDDICLIDWEYAAMGDYGCDIGNFIAQGSGYTLDEALAILPDYFGREPTDEERLHCVAATAVVGWYWYVWALFKECKGSPVGRWTRIWYDAARDFGHAAQQMIDESCSRRRALSRPEFDALVACEAGRAVEADQRVLENLAIEGFARKAADDAEQPYQITTAGFMALEPYRARRAVFFAAGFGSRMLPITVNTPKPLVRVHGKRFIERLLDAVIAAGIDEIYVVRGYLADEFDVLLKKYPQITFIDNPLFDQTNNISSAVAAKDHFSHAYAFESDLYLTDPSYISKYQYETNYLAFPVEKTGDWMFEATDDGRITKLAKGNDKPCWQMVGLSYWNGEDGARLATDLPEVFEEGDDERQIFWDDVPLRVRADGYNVHVRECDPAHIVEIDSFAELQEVDPSYRPR